MQLIVSSFGLRKCNRIWVSNGSGLAHMERENLLLFLCSLDECSQAALLYLSHDAVEKSGGIYFAGELFKHCTRALCLSICLFFASLSHSLSYSLSPSFFPLPFVPPFTYSVFPSSLFSLYIASTSISVLLLPSLPLNSPSPPPALSLANDNHCISSTQKPSSVKSDTSRCANRAAPL